MKQLFFVSLFLQYTLYAQIAYIKKSIRLPKFINESSGICKMPDGRFLTFNDSGNTTEVYVLDSLGYYIKTIKLKGPKNIDWEAITACGNTVYLADIGNNFNNRNIFELYRFTYNTTHEEFTADKIRFSYKHNAKPNKAQWGHNFDAEAVICVDDKIYIFSKNRTRPYNGMCYLYKIETSYTNSEIIPIDSTIIGTNGFFSNSVTDAAIAPSEKMLALITTKKIYLFYDFEGDNFFKGKRAEFTFDKFTQKEAVCFLNNHTIVVTDEHNRFLPGGKMYFYELTPFLNGNNIYRSSEIERIDVNIKLNNTNEGICEFKLQLNTKNNTIDTLWVEVHTPQNGIAAFFKIYNVNNIISVKVPVILYYTLANQNYFFRVYHNNKLLYSSKIKHD